MELLLSSLSELETDLVVDVTRLHVIFEFLKLKLHHKLLKSSRCQFSAFFYYSTLLIAKRLIARAVLLSHSLQTVSHMSSVTPTSARGRKRPSATASAAETPAGPPSDPSGGGGEGSPTSDPDVSRVTKKHQPAPLEGAEAEHELAETAARMRAAQHAAAIAQMEAKIRELEAATRAYNAGSAAAAAAVVQAEPVLAQFTASPADYQMIHSELKDMQLIAQSHWKDDKERLAFTDLLRWAGDLKDSKSTVEMWIKLKGMAITAGLGKDASGVPSDKRPLVALETRIKLYKKFGLVTSAAEALELKEQNARAEMMIRQNAKAAIDSEGSFHTRRQNSNRRGSRGHARGGRSFAMQSSAAFQQAVTSAINALAVPIATVQPTFTRPPFAPAGRGGGGRGGFNSRGGGGTHTPAPKA